ncbi:MAG: MCE family protein [Rhodocyclaceae bacterium]|nr:MCE family protein [Rhodocyclaceae bacterium]
MENRAYAIATGLFMLVLGAALAGALWWFGAPTERVQRFLLESSGNITGLNLEAQVRFRGIDAGKVEAIGIDPADPRKILVRISLRDDLPVTRGTTASLGYQGVTGLAYVQLEDAGEDLTPLSAPGGALPRIELEPGLIDQASSAVLNTLEQISALSNRLTQILSEENVKRVERSLDRIERASANVERTFDEAPKTLIAIREAVSEDQLGRLPQVLENFEKVGREATPAIRDFRQMVSKLEGTASNFDRLFDGAGQGLMTGTLPRLNALLQELADTSRQISSLFREVEAAPQMLLLGRGRQPPGPGESGYEGPVTDTAEEEKPKE